MLEGFKRLFGRACAFLKGRSFGSSKAAPEKATWKSVRSLGKTCEKKLMCSLSLRRGPPLAGGRRQAHDNAIDLQQCRASGSEATEKMQPPLLFLAAN